MPTEELQNPSASPVTALCAGDDLLTRIRRLARRQRNLLDRLSRAEELADALTFEVAELEAAILHVAGGGLPDDASRRSAKSSPEATRLLRGAAAAGVERLKARQLADGSYAVRVDHGKEFRLPPVLGELLAVLALDSGITSDGLVGWKTADEVALLLAPKKGAVMSRHAVSQNVYRLRKALFERGGVNPYLVQTSRRQGLRFALRQTKEPAGLRSTGFGDTL